MISKARLYLKFMYICALFQDPNRIAIDCRNHHWMSKIETTYKIRTWSILTMLAAVLLLQWALPSRVSAQVLRGKVYTLGEKGDTVPVYMARLQWLNTAAGAMTEKDGSYRLNFAGTDTLIISYSFFKPDTVVINRNERKRDFLINATQPLKEVVVSRKRQKYVRKGNPAIELVRNVIKHKDENRIENADIYHSYGYKKLVMTFGRFDVDLQKNRFRKQFSFLEKYVDTIYADTTPVLTISLRENLTERYYQKSPRKTVNYVKAIRMQGVDESFDEEGLGANLDDIFTEVNIYDNDIELMANRFVSPLSSTLATTFYHYYITDTLEVDSVSCIELTFTPVNTRDFGFSGRLYVVNDSSYALKHFTINVPHNINMNFVNRLVVDQSFTKVDSLHWAPKESHTYAQFSFFKFKMSKKIYAHQTNLWYKYAMDDIMPDSIAAASSGEVLVAEKTKYIRKQWLEMRPLPLSVKESYMDSLATELRRTPLFRGIEKTAEIFGTGYIATAKDRKDSYFDIGSIYNMISRNPSEGLRLRIGGTTTAKLHDQWFMSGYLAFGCRDLRLKYNVTMIYTFQKKKHQPYESPKSYISLSSSYDVEIPGQQYTYMDRDNLFMSYDYDKTVIAAQYVRRTKLLFRKEWPSSFSFESWLQYENNEATGLLAYWSINRDGSVSPVGDFNDFEWGIKLRWAPGERAANNRMGDKQPLRLSKNAPVFTLTHTFGILDQNFWYHRTDLSIEKRFWLSAFGHIDATLQAGIIWDAVPYPKLYVPQNNQSLFLTLNTFNLMKPMEFIMDKYVALFATYYLKGWIFNRIPFWNRLRLREVVSFSGVYGSLSNKNIPTPQTPGLYLFPDGCGMLGKVPYMEFTAGIENIFQFLRIDYVRRISYAKNLRGWDRNGIRFTFRISF